MNDTVKRINGPTILLRSGAYFDFEDPHGSDFTIEDIAHGLSNLCRFTGHTVAFYSVAEHSVWCSRMAQGRCALAALLHDAPEAFIGDLNKPLKTLLPDYARIEARVEAAVFARFGLPRELPGEVKVIDRQMLRAEQEQAMGNRDDWYWADGRAAPVTLEFWNPARARAEFLKRYRELLA